MAVKYKGRIFYYVDTIVVEDIIYDIYEDLEGNRYTRVIGTTY